MEMEQKEVQKLDLLVLLDNVLKEAKRYLVLALVLVLICGAGCAGYRYATYSPVYTASASFTVKAANPLYAGASSYNIYTAEQLAKTFPYILTSGALKERIRENLGISYMPSVSVTANSSASIITMKVTDSDPQRAYDVLNALMAYYPEVAEFVVGSTVLITLDESGVPTRPDHSLDLGDSAKKGMIAGAAIWMALVVVMAMLRRTIHNEDELKHVLNTSCVSQIPAAKHPRNTVCPLVHKSKMKSGFPEAIRLLRMRVQKYMEEQGHKVLLISSAIPSEGKTTVSVNLGISLAKKGKRVLIVDCDLRNPSVTKSLQLKSEKSLADFLLGKSTVREIILSTDVENLFVISSGSGGNRGATEMLSQKRISWLIRATGNLFDFVILDTPPCSMLADAAEISSLADCGLMVIRQDFASRDQILDGIQRLGEGGLPIIGCVINGMQRGFSSGYGYGYGYGYGEKKKK